MLPWNVYCRTCNFTVTMDIVSFSGRCLDCSWYGGNLEASEGWIVYMWFLQEVANHPVVVLPQVVSSIIQLAATFWFQATAPVLRMFQRMYVHVICNPSTSWKYWIDFAYQFSYTTKCCLFVQWKWEGFLQLSLRNLKIGEIIIISVPLFQMTVEIVRISL